MAGRGGRSRPHLNFAGKARGYDYQRPPDNYAVGPTVGLVKVNGQIPSLLHLYKFFGLASSSK